MKMIYDDYKKEILIPYKLSSLGPCLETADVNGDKNDDFFLGNGSQVNHQNYTFKLLTADLTYLKIILGINTKVLKPLLLIFLISTMMVT
jgi:hypothetical protein